MAARPGWFDRLRPAVGDVDAHDIVTRAIRSAGSSDFESLAWSLPLEMLTRSRSHDARLNRHGRRDAIGLLSGVLADRASSERVPRAAASVVPPTIAVLGIAGSGASELAIALGATAVDDLFTSEFVSLEFESRWHVPSYAEWLADADLTDAYSSVAQRLRRIDETSRHDLLSGHHVITGALHLEHLDLLASIIGEDTGNRSKIVIVHRDPVACLDIEGARAVELRASSSDEVDPVKVRRYLNWRTELLLDRFVATTERSDAPTLIELNGDAVLANPTAAAATVADLRTASDDLGPFSVHTTTPPPKQTAEDDSFANYRDYLRARRQ